ncbi:2TM domain-containing protein [Flavobacterium muglaense]|uniref:2TM domain-containing protein n=1 Tax=Flavobacterium muglaense TaxID=2764716 RepID=A0A923MXL5_9FLAO|nr:2TM domain-containing protein [Flavobacterium muglaense]MBC5836848.1 2TM domain-containing protein [Flavobacterium muglaense]MBC5843377.1 2TM domain-containing protein [Flavobacterium muglaense]
MEREQHELYEYARRRLKQKKRLYFHFVVLFLASLFLFIATKIFELGISTTWYIWIITIWFFLFLLHFIKVFITDRFMNKNWERDQINRLVTLQQKKIEELTAQIKEDKP